MAKWLTDEEQRAWRAYLQATQQLFEGLDRELQRDAGLSHADYEILVRLSEADEGRMRMSDLADRTLFSRSRLSHAVARLEGDGLLRREACESDRRGTFAVLTGAGRERLEAAAPGHVAQVRRLLFDRLDAEQVGQLAEIFGTVSQRTV